MEAVVLDMFLDDDMKSKYDWSSVLKWVKF